jgi:hypothetical protein
MKEHNHAENDHNDHFNQEHSDTDIESTHPKQDPLTETYSILRSGQLYTGHGANHHQHHPIESIREFDYKGSKIVIKTSYNITINDHPVNPHVFVDRKGHLTTHALPNYTFNSAVDMIKSIVDCMNIDFSKDKAS